MELREIKKVKDESFAALATLTNLVDLNVSATRITDESAAVLLKMQKLELRACAARVHGPARPGRNYGINEIFHREMELVAQAESAYA